MGDAATDDGTDEALLDRARAALDDAYVPYSDYRVGAALRTAAGTVHTGANVETANYTNTLHAEEVALADAVTGGHRAFDRLAVASAAGDGITPCGSCRQSLAEFCDDGLVIVCADAGGSTRHTLGELLPAAMSGATLEAAATDGD
jgi:cytidine deaminase